jgi:hypothetical protein
MDFSGLDHQRTPPERQSYLIKPFRQLAQRYQQEVDNNIDAARVEQIEIGGIPHSKIPQLIIDQLI